MALSLEKGAPTDRCSEEDDHHKQDHQREREREVADGEMMGRCRVIISFSKLKIDRDANWVHCDHQHVVEVVVVDLLPPHYIHCILVKPPLGRATLMIVVVLSKSCSARTDPMFKSCC